MKLNKYRLSWFYAVLLALVFASANCCLSAHAQDWPQWGGPERDFKSTAKGLAARWPAQGPRRLWSRPLGAGHSAISAEAGRLYTLYRKDEREVVIALDAKTGKTIWETVYGAPYLPKIDMSYGDGPHATPLLAGNLLYTVGATAKLHCLDKFSGQVKWSHNLWREYNGTFIGVGYSSSPLLYRNTLIVQVGGAGQSVMAFDLHSGAVVWRAQDFKNSDASPLLITLDG